MNNDTTAKIIGYAIIGLVCLYFWSYLQPVMMVLATAIVVGLVFRVIILALPIFVLCGIAAWANAWPPEKTVATGLAIVILTSMHDLYRVHIQGKPSMIFWGSFGRFYH